MDERMTPYLFRVGPLNDVLVSEFHRGNKIDTYLHDFQLHGYPPYATLRCPMDLDAIQEEFDFADRFEIVDEPGKRRFLIDLRTEFCVLDGTAEPGRWARHCRRSWWKQWVRDPRPRRLPGDVNVGLQPVLFSLESTAWQRPTVLRAVTTVRGAGRRAKEYAVAELVDESNEVTALAVLARRTGRWWRLPRRGDAMETLLWTIGNRNEVRSGYAPPATGATVCYIVLDTLERQMTAWRTGHQRLDDGR